MKRALILTVGTGTRPETFIVRPLLKTIRNSHPDYLVLIISEASRQYAKEIVRELSLTEDQFRIVQLQFPDDIQNVFIEINGAVRGIIQRGFQPEEVEIDFTSGTKAMTGGAVLSAIFYSCGSLKYITGERKNGVVMDGTEKFLTIPPQSIFALQELYLARRFILELRFEPALRFLESINIHLLDDYQRVLLENLKNIARAYGSWEAFDHKRFSGYYGKVDFGQPELLPFRVKEGIPSKLVGISKTIQEGKITENVLVDIYNNARRRFDDGKYDDALSRLYRLAEMLAQWELSKPPLEINTSDVDIQRIPEERRGYYETLRDKDGKIQIGLKKSYELLALFGSPVADLFLKDGKIRALLNKRNLSILAHGTKPISREDCHNLFECLEPLLAMRIFNFNALREELGFPWRRIGQA
jgi:hypothetical protein